MNKRIFTYTLLVLLFMLVVPVSISCDDTVPEADQDIISTGAHVSWSKGYSNLTDMVTDTDLIVIGKVERVFETIQASEQLYFTNFVFSIEKVLKGNENGEIIVHQLGFADKPSTIVIDDPLFEIEGEYLLFLFSNPSGVYSHSGPVTRYQIMDNKVYSMNYILPANEYVAPDSLDFNGVAVSEISDRITSTLDEFRILSYENTRLLSGETGTIDITMATGKSITGKAVYTLTSVSSQEHDDTIPLPEGMTVSIHPGEFFVLPHNDYKSVITISTEEQVIIPGEYWISVGYSIDDTVSGQRIIHVVIDEKKLSEIETRPE